MIQPETGAPLGIRFPISAAWQLAPNDIIQQQPLPATSDKPQPQEPLLQSAASRQIAHAVQLSQPADLGSITTYPQHSLRGLRTELTHGASRKWGGSRCSGQQLNNSRNKADDTLQAEPCL